MPTLRPFFHRILAFLQNPWGSVRRLSRPQVVSLLVVLFLLFCILVFVDLARDVSHGETQRFDERVIRSLRRADDPAVPIGPAWLRGAGLDATSLGSPLVLLLVVGAVLGFMALEGKYRVMWLTFVTTAGGGLLAFVLKHVIERERPTVVPRLREVSSPSFPSGHAMISAIVYLTLAALLTQIVQGRLTKIYFILCAMVLTILVGASRVYLGVHYPTDVFAGWIAGFVWALGWWVVAQYLQSKGTIEGEGPGPPQG